VLLVLVLFVANLMKKARNMLSPMHPKSNNKAESNYSSYEGECLVVIWAVIHFRPYLYGTKFILYTDHHPMKWLMTNNKLTNKLAR
jgi:hypothetical protein